MTGLVAGATRLYGIIGEPIAQVRSPAVFNAAFRQSGVDAVLVPLQVPRDGFVETMRGLMRLGNLGGFMITIPHKQATMALVDEIRPRARRVGAINAVRREADGRWVADMFDGLGFVLGLEKSGHKLAGRRLLLVGAGGAGSAIADAAAEAGAAAMTIVDLDRAKAERLAATIAAARRRRDLCRCAGAGGPRPGGQRDADGHAARRPAAGLARGSDSGHACRRRDYQTGSLAAAGSGAVERLRDANRAPDGRRAVGRGRRFLRSDAGLVRRYLIPRAAGR